MINLSLPIPPSNNNYYRHARGRNFISADGKAYKINVAKIVKESDLGLSFCLSDRVSVKMEIYPRDKRRRDIDNYPKAIFDALTAAHVWDDDTIVDDLHIIRKPPDCHDPRVVIVITKFLL